MRVETRKPRLGFFPSCGCAMECPRWAWPRITCTILMIFEVRVFLCVFFARSAAISQMRFGFDIGRSVIERSPLIRSSQVA